jgi:hypothetical protein
MALATVDYSTSAKAPRTISIVPWPNADVVKQTLSRACDQSQNKLIPDLTTLERLWFVRVEYYGNPTQREATIVYITTSNEENSKGHTEEDLGRYCGRGVESARCCESRREAAMLNLHTASAVR